MIVVVADVVVVLFFFPFLPPSLALDSSSGLPVSEFVCVFRLIIEAESEKL